MHIGYHDGTFSDSAADNAANSDGHNLPHWCFDGNIFLLFLSDSAADNTEYSKLMDSFIKSAYTLRYTGKTTTNARIHSRASSSCLDTNVTITCV